jgi:hypothetical protein
VTTAATTLPRTVALSRWISGRHFVHPLFDTLVIGAGLSLPVLALVLFSAHLPGLRGLTPFFEGFGSSALLPWAILIFTGTHFAASTVRLYTKPEAVQQLPFLALGFPLVVFALLTLCIARPVDFGWHLQALYLTGSPYHYAAQAYGVAVMYCMRAGCPLAPREKSLLRAVALAPFAYAFISAAGTGLHWLAPAAIKHAELTRQALALLRPALMAAGLGGPVLLWLAFARRARPMPAISALALAVNGIWWFFLPPIEAFVWATFFHGLQYLALVMIFHVREQTARPGNRRGPVYHGLWFYTVCLLLAYAIFNCVPQAYVFAGFSLTESLLLVTAAINLHHFVVDGFIWRLARDARNRSVVDSGLAPPAGTR